MNTPQEVENQPGTNRPVGEPMDATAAIGQLRELVCGLGAGLLIVSLALTAYVYKQNRNLTAAITIRQHQISQLQSNESSLKYLLTELVKYSNGKPELAALFARHGIQVNPAAASSSPTPQR
jgi:hypothetical protein